MRNNKLTVIILMFTLATYHCNGQEYELTEKSATGIFEINEKSKSELFTLITKWVTINYNSAKNVIQMNDKESGTIIIKGINEVVYKNTSKVIYPNNKYIQDHLTTKFNHLIQIDIKDNRYRISYRIIDIASEDLGFNSITLKCISLNGTNEQSITEYNKLTVEYLKKGLVGEKKREEFLSLTKPMFEEINANLLSDIKITMKSIEKSVLSKDDW